MNKLKLFENTYHKLCNDRAFMAFYLNEVSVKENRTVAEMVVLLNCSLEDYYKLALCKAPEITSLDFTLRIEKIAEYSNTSAIILTNIIKYSTVQQKTEVIQSTSEFWNIFKKILPLPQWFTRSQAKIYQVGVSFCFIFFFVFTYTSQKHETKNLQFYANDYFSYTDSIKYSQLPDNTFVYKNNL